MPDTNRPQLPLLFLSHAGIDTEAARALKQRLEAAPEAREYGLRVWFDKDDLRAGEPWQAQLEEVIQRRSAAFAVYVGSRGVVNWVDAEIQLALSRAVTDPSYRFIPILAPQAPGPEALPGFVALYQGVADVEGRPDQFARLVAAILGRDAAGTAKLEAEPFFGLKAVDEDRAHLFFGREQETEALLQLLRREPLVMVTGDSGSGKSSLVRAGLVPRWRGGTLAETMGERPAETIWHVVQTQPRTRPFQALAEAVGEAAKRLGLSLADRGTLESWARSGDPAEVRRALWCDLPPDRTRVLLLVDQFEELVTIAEPAEREPFVRLLLALADPNDPRARVVLTMRRDYYNLVSTFPKLYDRLEADSHRARQILGRISPDGLRRIVTEPLRLAGGPEGDRIALADQVVAEMGDRPGDLALVQMALTETWHRRRGFDDDLLRAYAGVGRIEGAIARAAEEVYTNVLDEAEHALAEPVFVRLVRLGDTGGATRRLASRVEFGDAKWRLVQKLASKEAKRLVLVGGGEAGENAEIAHEALVTQWPRYQTWLSGRDPDGGDRAADKRVLDAVTHRAVAWAAAPDGRAKAQRLATGADLETFVGLAGRRPVWLSADEHQFVSDSREAARRQQRREQGLFRGIVAAAVVALLLAAGTGWQWLEAQAQTRRAIAEAQRAETQTDLAQQREQEASAERDKANAAAERAQTTTGRLLGTEAQRRLAEPITQDTSPLIAALATAGWRLGKASDAWNAMQRVPSVTTLARIPHDGAVTAVAFSPDGQLLATASGDTVLRKRGEARLVAVADGHEVARVTHDDAVRAVAFSPDGQLLATASDDGTARLVAVADGRERARITHNDIVLAVAFSPDGQSLATAGRGNAAQLVAVADGHEVARITHDGAVTAVAFSPDGQLLATASGDKKARLWSTAFDDMLHQLCAGQGRNLSLGEWRRYLGDLPWQPTCESWPTPKD
jgi:roadblock/LC7 domain-containing protein